MSMRRHLSAASALLVISTVALAETPDLGHPATPEEIAVWDISIGPDGAGLPRGSGSPQQGEAVYLTKCLPCHGEKGSGKPNDQLVGGLGTLTGDQTAVKTVGNFWPYATTLFDYVRRAMPFNAPRSLSDDEVYAVCAYILRLNGIIAENAVMNARTLAEVQMPNRDGFVFFPPEIGAITTTMDFAFAPLSISTRRKLTSILLAVVIFAVLAGLVTSANGRPIVFGVVNAIFVGIGVGLFEEFYVQSLRGRWIRNIHPLRAIVVYTIVVVILFLIAIHVTHVILWPFYKLPVPYGRLPVVIPVVISFSVIGIVVMRTAHFIGIETLFHLTVGTYHRPVLQEKVLVFLDINNSTALAEELGAVRTKSLVGKFLFDTSKPITDHGGDIYLYKGDGLIALWDWREAIRDNRILRTIDAVFATIRRERREYMEQFGVVPSFRIGVHGGEVVVSEQGDTKRAIGVYGTTINIAARMEEAANTMSRVQFPGMSPKTCAAKKRG